MGEKERSYKFGSEIFGFLFRKTSMLGVLGNELSELSGKFVLQATWKTSDFRGLERAKVGLCLLSTLSKRLFSEPSGWAKCPSGKLSLLCLVISH